MVRRPDWNSTSNCWSCVKYSEPHIILSRTDGIGDVVLTLPLAGWIRKNIPSARIAMLVRPYTASIAECSSHIDSVLVWDERSTDHQHTLREALHHATHLIHVFPNKAIARLAKQIRVPERLGTSHRLYHWWLCNHLVNVGRKNSSLHESQLNCRLAEPLFDTVSIPTLEEIPDLYGFYAREGFPARYSTAEYARTAVIHPLSQGSAPRWSLHHWQTLAELLCTHGWRVIVTGSKVEGEQLREFFSQPVIATHIMQGSIVNACGDLTLHELIGLISGVQAVVAASTGPLHIAAALGVHCVGLYVARRPLHAGRWGALGKEAHIIEQGKAECSSCSVRECLCIQSIQPSDVIAILNEKSS